MTGRMYFTFISSFLMGMISGAFFFVTVFAPEYVNDISSSENTGTGLVIRGQTYGGCDRGDACASFRLRENGNYEFFSSPSSEKVEGKLPSSLRSDIKNIFNEQFLKKAEGDINAGDCDSYVDGIDFSYEVTQGGGRYVLDTCTTAFAYEENVQELLLNAWYHMENPEAEDTKTYDSSGNIFDVLIWDRFHNPKD